MNPTASAPGSDSRTLAETQPPPTESGSAIAGALVAAQKILVHRPLKKDREVEVRTKTGQTYRFRYATLDAVMELVRPVLAEAGIAVIQSPAATEGFVTVTTTLIHTSGERWESALTLPTQNEPQAVGSAISYARRYSLCAMLALCADEDDDGNAAQGNHAAPAPPARSPRPTPASRPPQSATPAAGSPAPPQKPADDERSEGGASIKALRLLQKLRRDEGCDDATLKDICRAQFNQESTQKLGPGEVSFLIDAFKGEIKDTHWRQLGPAFEGEEQAGPDPMDSRGEDAKALADSMPF